MQKGALGAGQIAHRTPRHAEVVPQTGGLVPGEDPPAHPQGARDVRHDLLPLARLAHGAHQPAEQVYGHTLYVTWFAGGLRAVDFTNPYMPKEVGYYVPMPGKGQSVVMSNDVFHDKDGKLYLMDRYDGLEILEPQI